jgi:hypothetical protein
MTLAVQDGLRGANCAAGCGVSGVPGLPDAGRGGDCRRGAGAHGDPERGLQDQGAVLLGGDAQMEFTYRFATDDERAWMEGIAERRVRDRGFPVDGRGGDG